MNLEGSNVPFKIRNNEINKMYSDKKNILQLVALLEAHGITKVVLCPGSRNAPIVHTLTSHPGFTCYSVTDERSAGYFALGLSLQEGKPAAVCCTSGTALLNLHPAVAEAFYQQVPLVVISADRPAAWIGQMDGQTLPQPGVFNTLVKKSVSLPEVHTDEDEWYCNRLVNEALLATVHHGRGPVHINILISEPLFQFTTERLPKVRVIKRCMNTDGLKQLFSKNNLADILKSYDKRMFVIGQSATPGQSETESIRLLSGNFVFLSEHLGNQPTIGSYLKNFDTLLYALPKTEMDAMAPELLITYGGHIVSKRLKNFLRKHPPREHWHISPDGEVVDLFGCLSTIIEMSPEAFLSDLKNNSIPDASGYSLLWKEKCNKISEPDFSYSEMSAIGTLLKSLPQESVLHLANSSAVRYAQLFSLPSDSIRVCCNRGTSGIEGSLSTAVGYATAWSEQLNFIVIGDLSFFYDMNALWNNNYGCNLRIMLLNNSGGEIFHTLPGLDMSGSSHQFVTATHQTSAEGWAKERGFAYLKVENEERLEQAMELFASPYKQDCPILMEVFTDKNDDTRILKDYYHQLKTTVTL